MSRKKESLERDEGGPLPPHFVVYDHDDPSPVFTPEQVADIELPGTFLTKEDLARVRAMETWVLNTNTGWFNNPEIPGLRPDSDRDHCYVKRFSDERFEAMIDKFLDHLVPEFKPPGPPCNMPLSRVTLPNGDRYYPIMYHDDLDKWRRVLKQAAAHLQTELARFDRGTFVVSDGTIHPFSAISIEKIWGKAPIPQDW